ncbi:MAG: Holliday junction resolvase RuvX [Opitutales bacterium]|nr:Holliday junction resolvase RuvX [Opitutales bacterium]
MDKYLGIDYGERRIGLSFGDELGLAFPEQPANQDSPEDRFRHLEHIIKSRRITRLVVGMPYHMNGAKGAKAREAEAFGEELARRFGMPVDYVDERLSSSEAKARMGKKFRDDPAFRKTGQLDSAAATLILQDYLDEKGFGQFPHEEGGEELW